MLFNKIRTAGNNAKPYSIVNKADVVEVYIYDEISYWGINSDTFVKDFDAIDSKNINVRINSPGGSVFDGVAIAAAISRHSATVTAYVDGMAASIASLIMLAADEVVAAPNSMVMIHEPWSIAAGNKGEFLKVADLLEKIEGNLNSEYVKKTGLEPAEVTDLMVAETWFTAEEALEIKLIDRIEGPQSESAKNVYDLSNFKNAPKIEEEEKPEANMALARARKLDLMSKQI